MKNERKPKIKMWGGALLLAVLTWEVKSLTKSVQTYMKNTFEESFLVDSNILVYYLDADSKYNSLLERFFVLCEEKKLPATVSLQNIVELTSVLVKKYKVPKRVVIEKVRRLVHGGLFQVISPFPSSTNKFFEIMGMLSNPDIYDVFLTATMMDNNVFRILTNNENDFKNIKNLGVWGLEEVKKIIGEHE